MVPELHARLNLLVKGYSSESEGEVDILNDINQGHHEQDEIVMILGNPYLALD